MMKVNHYASKSHPCPGKSSFLPLKNFLGKDQSLAEKPSTGKPVFVDNPCRNFCSTTDNFKVDRQNFEAFMARQKAFKKEEVLDKAMHLFWRKGYHGTSMQDLVDHLGISRSSMYDTFGGKYDLFLNSLSRYQSRQSEAVDRALSSDDDLQDFLRSFFMGVVEECRQDEEHKGCFTVNTSVELASHDEKIGTVV